MRNIIVGLLLICFVVNACHKEDKEDDTPQPTTGSLSGVVAPIEAAQSITARLKSNVSQSITVVPDASTGAFKFSNLSAGDYIVELLSNSPYKSPDNLEISVRANKNTDLGTLTLVTDSISCKVNGTAMSRNAQASYNSPTFSTSVIGSSLSYTYQLNIHLDAVTGPGTYVCKGTATSYINYSTKSWGTPPISRNWSSANAGGSATITITNIDPVTKTISGTFAATLMAAAGIPTGNQVSITDGAFTMTYK